MALRRHDEHRGRRRMSFDDLIATLAQEYLVALPGKIDLIKKEAQAGAVADLQTSFHKLKGTGRTYGFPEITEIGAVIERICKERPTEAAAAALLGAEVLDAIHTARARKESFSLSSEPRFHELQKLLQK
jgi:hypothetical protein